MRELKLALALCVMLCLAACGGGGGNSGGFGSSSTPTWTITSVTPSCNPNSVQSSLTTNCSATVSGTGTYSSAVTWSATAGTITQAGVYTAPSVTANTQVTVTATAAYDTTKTGSTTVTVTPPSNITYIQVTCSPQQIQTGQLSQCSANVQGPTPEPQTVSWSATIGFPGAVDCQCISPSGIVTGPVVGGLGEITITARSTVDSTKYGSTTMYIYSPGTVTSVTPSCTKTTLNPGQDTLCTAVVTGTGGYSSAVGWRSTYGDTLPSGLYIASKSNTNYTETITAASAQDSSVFSTTTVTVTPSTTTPNNVAPLIVDGGPSGVSTPYVNAAFMSVTVCVPGTSNCQTIDHVLVDTGSVGLRLLAAGVGGELNLPLPQYIDLTSGFPLAECAPFVSGFLWGPIATADVYSVADFTGEQAPNIEIQVIGVPGGPSVPTGCSNQGADLSNLKALGANGIIGVGVFSTDCGQWCFDSFNIPYIYFTCPPTGCSESVAFFQVSNPVSSFLADNHGTVMQLPNPPDSAPVQGSLIFGINSQPNNQLGSATMLLGDGYTGEITTSYQGIDYQGSFLDSGSNGFFFLNSQTLGAQMPTCSDRPEWYCPLAPQIFTATNKGITGTSSTATFTVGNADHLFQTSGATALPSLGGTWPLTPLVFDFGLPFFYGRSVYTQIGGPPFQVNPGFAY